MLKENITFKKIEGSVVVVDIHGTTEQYAMAWLKLTNNAREYPNMILKIKNNRHDDTVEVICEKKHVEAVKQFCDGLYCDYDEKNDKFIEIGKVINVYNTVIGIPVYEFESDADDWEQWEKDIDSAVQVWANVREFA